MSQRCSMRTAKRRQVLQQASAWRNDVDQIAMLCLPSQFLSQVTLM